MHRQINLNRTILSFMVSIFATCGSSLHAMDDEDHRQRAGSPPIWGGLYESNKINPDDDMWKDLLTPGETIDGKYTPKSRDPNNDLFTIKINDVLINQKSKESGRWIDHVKDQRGSGACTMYAIGEAMAYQILRSVSVIGGYV